jgi:hypothetical protein
MWYKREHRVRGVKEEGREKGNVFLYMVCICVISCVEKESQIRSEHIGMARLCSFVYPELIDSLFL